MAFGDFDLKTVRDQFGLTLDERRDLFSSVPALEVPARPAPGVCGGDCLDSPRTTR
jgi:hypothetical protein